MDTTKKYKFIDNIIDTISEYFYDEENKCLMLIPPKPSKTKVVVNYDEIDLEERPAPYYIAKMKGKEALGDFWINIYNKSKKILSKIFGKEDAKNIKEIDVDDAIKAINENKFDFTTGEIKN